MKIKNESIVKIKREKKELDSFKERNLYVPTRSIPTVSLF